MLDDIFEFEFESDEEAKKVVIFQSIILIIKGIFTTGALITTIVRFTKHGEDGYFYLGLAFIFTIAACFAYKFVIYIIKIYTWSFGIIPIPVLHLFVVLFALAIIVYFAPAIFAVASLLESSVRYTAAKKYLTDEY